MTCGTMTVNPETKNSVRICAMMVQKTKALSLYIVGKIAGRCRPRRATRASIDSSTGRSLASARFPGVGDSSNCAPGSGTPSLPASGPEQTWLIALNKPLGAS